MRPLQTLSGARSIAVLSISLILAACTTSPGVGTSGPTQVALGTLVATAVPQATVSEPSPSSAASTGTGPGGSAAPTSIDPCSLLTQDEASTAVGVKLGAGVSALVTQNRVCTWKVGTTEVKLIMAPPAADAATAQGYWDQERAQIPGDVPVHDVAGFDRAAYGTGGTSGFTISALFVIKGSQFFDFYCGLKACTEAASVVAANLIVGRLP